MRFMMTLRPDQKPIPPSPALMEAIDKLVKDMTAAGVLVDTGGIQETGLLTLAGGTLTLTDGPFSEAKEVIGGYAILKTASKAEAIQLAKRFLQIHVDILGPSYETVAEVRQLFSPEELGPPGQQ
jgi:hypothetical protein